MGTKTARQFYIELEEVPTFSKLTSTGIEDDTDSVFKFAEEYANEKTQHQAEVIEKLIKELKQSSSLNGGLINEAEYLIQETKSGED